MSEFNFAFEPNSPLKIRGKVGRPKGSKRNAYKTIPKRTVKSKAVPIKAYSWIYDVVEPYLEVWFFNMSDFMRTAVRDAMLFCQDLEISYFIRKSREQRIERKNTKELTGDKDEPLCFKLLEPAVKQVDTKCEQLRHFNRGNGIGNVTRTDYIKAAILWYDEEYSKPKIENSKIELKKEI